VRRLLRLGFAGCHCPPAGFYYHFSPRTSIEGQWVNKRHTLERGRSEESGSPVVYRSPRIYRVGLLIWTTTGRAPVAETRRAALVHVHELHFDHLGTASDALRKIRAVTHHITRGPHGAFFLHRSLILWEYYGNGRSGFARKHAHDFPRSSRPRNSRIPWVFQLCQEGLHVIRIERRLSRCSTPMNLSGRAVLNGGRRSQNPPYHARSLFSLRSDEAPGRQGFFSLGEDDRSSCRLERASTTRSSAVRESHRRVLGGAVRHCGP